MKNHPAEKQWRKEFQAFLQLKSEDAPSDITRAIKHFVHEDLRVSRLNVFLKLIGIHIPIGLLSLAICHQFGMNPFQTSFSLDHYFMYMGHSTCMILCGVLFVGLSTFISSWALKLNELAVLRQSILYQVCGLSIFSLFSFFLAGAEVTMGIFALWFLGGMLGGPLGTEMVFRLRTS